MTNITKHIMSHYHITSDMSDSRSSVCCQKTHLKCTMYKPLVYLPLDGAFVAFPSAMMPAS